MDWDDSLPSDSHFVHHEHQTSRPKAQLSVIKKKAFLQQATGRTIGSSGGRDGRSPPRRAVHVLEISPPRQQRTGRVQASPPGRVARVAVDPMEIPLSKSSHAHTAPSSFNQEWDKPAGKGLVQTPRTPIDRTAPKPFLKRGSRVEPSYAIRKKKHVNPENLLSTTETDDKRKRSSKTSVEHFGPTRGQASNRGGGQSDVDFELVLKHENGNPNMGASSGRQNCSVRPKIRSTFDYEGDFRDMFESSEESYFEAASVSGRKLPKAEEEEIILRQEDGYWRVNGDAGVSTSLDDPLEMSTVSISARTRAQAPPASRELDDFATLELQVGQASVEPREVKTRGSTETLSGLYYESDLPVDLSELAALNATAGDGRHRDTLLREWERHVDDDDYGKEALGYFDRLETSTRDLVEMGTVSAPRLDDDDNAYEAFMAAAATSVGRPRSYAADDSYSWGAVSGPSLRGGNKDLGYEDSAGPGSRAIVGIGEGGRPIVRIRPRIQPDEGAARPNASSSRPRGQQDKRIAGNEAALQEELQLKARELESELATYKAENAAMKQLKRQQEGLVAELVSQRGELAKWVADEKARAAMWCEEQRASAAKERRSAAKQAKDARDRLSAPGGLLSRKERAEVESLQATVEKLRIDHDSAIKKFKLNEKRLMQNIKDQLAAAEDHNQLILALERDKMELLEVLADQGHLPALKSRSLAGELARQAAIRRITRGSDSYVEEVSVSGLDAGVLVTMEDRPFVDENISSSGSHFRRHDADKIEKDNDEESEGALQVQEEVRASWSSRSAGRYSTTASHENEVRGEATTRFASHTFTVDMSRDNRPAERAENKEDKVEERLADGTRLVSYRNGTTKEVRPGGDTSIRFANGDTKRIGKDGVTQYYYAQAQTTHTTLSDGTERYEFPSGQTETHFGDGRKEILFPDRTRKVVHVSGLQESTFADGVVVREFPSGLREIITADGKVHQDFSSADPSKSSNY